MSESDRRALDLELRLLTCQGRRFETGGRLYELVPRSLGGEILLLRDVEELELDGDALLRDPMMTLLRTAGIRREASLRVVARATMRSREDHLDGSLMQMRIRALDESLDADELATLLSVVLSDRDMEEYSELAGLDEEQRLLRRIGAVRGEESGIESFGGRTLFGRLIDTACERYGWSYEYVVWGLPREVLELMLRDRQTALTISDDERRKLGMRAIGEIDGDSASEEELRRLTE